MPGAYIFGWDATNEVWVKCLVNAEGKLIIDPSEIFENTPTDNEHGKAPDSDWAHDHAAVSDAHHAQLHAASHEDGGADEISVTGLDGMLNQKGNVSFPDRSFWLIYISAGQDISADVSEKMELDVVEHDNRGEFDSVNNRIVLNDPGFYWLSASLYFLYPGDQDLIKVQIFRNDDDNIGECRFCALATNHQAVNLSIGIYLNADDFLELYAMNEDSNDTIGAYAQVTFFSGCKVI